MLIFELYCLLATTTAVFYIFSRHYVAFIVSCKIAFPNARNWHIILASIFVWFMIGILWPLTVRTVLQ